MRFPHGGVEVGGVLLGQGNEGVLRVTQALPVSIEYANGAAFALSEDDDAALQHLIDRAGPANVIGWYQSHTRRDVALSESDLAIYDRHFSAPGSICLVMKPVLQEIEVMSVFLRSEDGTIIQSAKFEDVEVGSEAAAAAGAETPLESSTDAASTPPETMSGRVTETISQAVAEPASEPVASEPVSEEPLPRRVVRVIPPGRRPGTMPSWRAYAASAILVMGCVGAGWMYLRRAPGLQPVTQSPARANDSGTRNRAMPVAESVPPADKAVTAPTEKAVAAPADQTVTSKQKSTVKHTRRRRGRARRRG